MNKRVRPWKGPQFREPKPPFIGPRRLVVILDLHRVLSASEQDRRLRALLDQPVGARYDIELHPGRVSVPVHILAELAARHGQNIRFSCDGNPQLAKKYADAVGTHN